MRHQSKVLRALPLVEFDVLNPEHVKAVLAPRLTGRMHPNLRFELQQPFQTVEGMALHLIAISHLERLTGEQVNDTFISDPWISDTTVDSDSIQQRASQLKAELKRNRFKQYEGLGQEPSTPDVSKYRRYLGGSLDREPVPS